MFNPKVYVLLLLEILVGVALPSFAVLLVSGIDRTQSSTVSAPLLGTPGYAVSAKVTSTVALSPAIAMPVIVGPNLSLSVAELLLWLVIAMFPARSKIEFAAGFTVMVSVPLAGESKAIPSV